jgi:hypothetical protein
MNGVMDLPPFLVAKAQEVLPAAKKNVKFVMKGGQVYKNDYQK